MCGRPLGSRAKMNSKVYVRVVRHGAVAIAAGGLECETPCPTCGARLEQYVTATVPMEATG